MSGENRNGVETIPFPFPEADGMTDGTVTLKLKRTAGANEDLGLLPAYHFDLLLTDGTRAGNCDLRIGYNDRSAQSGHISYTVYALYRGRHYAARACRLLFVLAARHGMRYLLICCEQRNIASDRTCRLLGGKLTGTAEYPCSNGRKTVNVYRFEL